MIPEPTPSNRKKLFYLLTAGLSLSHWQIYDLYAGIATGVVGIAGVLLGQEIAKTDSTEKSTEGIE